MLTHVDLFSGIGGFALAARWAGVETIAFAEIDPYASRVLERHFGGVRNYGRVQDVPAIDNVWLVTGGVPCQPASVAGQRRGADDDRWLWPEAIAAVERLKPDWVCLENPLGILSLEKPIMSLDLEGYGNLVEAAISSEGDFWANVTGEVGIIFRDLVSSVEKLGYEVSPVVIPACGLGAWHKRYRVWIMGHATSIQPRAEQQSARPNIAGYSGAESLPHTDGARELQPQGRFQEQRRRTGNNGSADDADPSGNGRKGFGDGEVSQRSPNDGARPETTGSGLPITANPDNDTSTRFREHGWQIHGEPTARRFGVGGGDEWWATEPNVGRVAYGIPSRLDRLRTLGNAIVPQVAYQLIKRMIEAEALNAKVA